MSGACHGLFSVAALVIAAFVVSEENRRDELFLIVLWSTQISDTFIDYWSLT